jgi:glutamate-1-semialdehyde 2,1-aminomutase
MAAGIASLAALDPERYVALEASAETLAGGLQQAAAAGGRQVAISRFGSLLTVFFRPDLPTDAAEAMTADRTAFARFFGAMLDRGILLPPSQFEAWFVSMAHGQAEIDATLEAAALAFRA